MNTEVTLNDFFSFCVLYFNTVINTDRAVI